MKKILVVVSDMNLGGVTTSVINFCNELQNRGNIVHFLNMGKANSEAEAKINTEVKRLRLVGLAAKWNLGMETIRNTSGLRKLEVLPLALVKKMTNHSEKWLNIVFRNYCIEEQYDVAVAFRQCAPCYYFVLNCVKSAVKLGFIHGNLKTMGNVSSFDSYFERFDSIACVSKACRDGFRERYPQIREKFAYVYNMFPVEDIKKTASEPCPISIDKDKFNIVTVSRVENASKGIERIPVICELLKKKGYSFRWYVLGDGPDYELDKQDAHERGLDDILVFYGASDNPHCIVKNCDLSVLPTKGEAYSMTVIESMIIGTPIVVSRYDGVEEAVLDGINGLIAEQSAESLEKKVSLCMEEGNNILKSIRENLRRQIYNNDIAYNQFIDILNELSKGN